MFKLWLAWRYLISKNNRLSLTSSLGVVGLSIGVASLFVSMAVVSGYETTLKQNITDVSGDLLIIKRRATSSVIASIREDLSSKIDEAFEMSPYIWLEGLMAHKGSLTGIFLEGAKVEGLRKVLKIEHRVIQGKLDLNAIDETPGAVVGVGLAKRFKLNIGDDFKVVLPFASDFETSGLRRKIQSFKVTGIIELGRHEYNQRYILADMDVVKSLLDDEDRISGVRVSLENEDFADKYKDKINVELGYPYWARSWRDHEKNLFKAVQLEKFVIFLVIFIMVIAACFNIASTLYVSVFRRYADISILKSMGFKSRQITLLFSLQGLLIGFIGSIAGLLLGLFLCGAFVALQSMFPLIPSETYRVSFINVDFRWIDIVTVVGSSMFICFISTLFPALRGAKLNPVEGLRYE
ncbi:MAG: ABC transporter permease [Bdellovibrionales bacterium]